MPSSACQVSKSPWGKTCRNQFLTEQIIYLCLYLSLRSLIHLPSNILAQLFLYEPIYLSICFPRAWNLESIYRSRLRSFFSSSYLPNPSTCPPIKSLPSLSSGLPIYSSMCPSHLPTYLLSTHHSVSLSIHPFISLISPFIQFTTYLYQSTCHTCLSNHLSIFLSIDRSPSI